MSRSLLLATIGSQADRHVCTQVGGYRRGATGELHVAFRVVRDSDAPRLEHRDVGVRDPHTVRPEHTGTEEAEAVEICDGRRFEAFLRRLYFVVRFGEMDQRWHVIALRELARGLERWTIECVHRVRSDGRCDQGVILEGFDECLGAHQRIGRRLGIRDEKLDDSLSQHAAEAGRLRRRGHFLLEVVHIGERRGARLNHLERREPRAGAHELRRDGLGFGREDVLVQPLAEREVIGKPAEQHHGCVGVRVDETRQHDLARAVDGVAASELLGDVVGGIDGDNVGAIDRDRAVGNHAVARIHGHDRATREDERHLARGVLGRHPGDGQEQACGKGKNPDSHRGILVLFHPWLFTSLRIRLYMMR